jgi:E3 ubiquitin-protein ligase NRDP1
MELACEYEYMNEGLIDDELKCSICHHPFVSPVSTDICGHTFCEKCIETWLLVQQTCPSCRRRVLFSDFKPVSIRVVLNLLNRIPVRCIPCCQVNIERGNFDDHKKQCIKRIVLCSFVNLSCSWTGKQDELSQHELICPYRRVQPLIDELQSQKKKLQSTVQKQAEQIRFLLILLNNGKPLNQSCVREDYCRVFYFSPNEQEEPKCDMCHSSIRHINIAFHHCDGGCLCKTCYQTHYPL